MIQDPMVFVVGGVELTLLVFGITEFLKNAMGLSGKPVTLIAIGLGFLFALAAQVAPDYPVFQLWFTRVVVALAFSLAAPGYYQFVTARLPKRN